MDPRLLELYNQELTHIRDVAREFAAQHPKIAAGLSLDAQSVQDPTVERLLEGFAFLTARTQLKLQTSFPEFTGQLLERLMPGATAPTPAMGVVQLHIQAQDPALTKGVTVPVGTQFQSMVVKGTSTAVSFRSAHPCTLWPLQLESVRHGAPQGEGLHSFRLSSVLHLRMHRTGAGSMADLPLDVLDFHVSAPQEWAFELHQRMACRTVVVAARGSSNEPWTLLPMDALSILGFDDREALLPEHNQVFSGFRLLHELFSLPERFLFFRIQHLLRVCQKVSGRSLEIMLGFQDSHPQMDRWVDAESLALHCVPVVNLFSMACDRVPVDPSQHELHLVPNRSRPSDFEVFAVQSMVAHATQSREAVRPLYAADAVPQGDDTSAIYYAIRRQACVLSERQQREGGRSSHVGTEVFIGLSMSHGRLRAERAVHQLSVQALCSNRDLPLLMPLGQSNTDLQVAGSFPVQSIRFVRGPSRPGLPLADGRGNWQLIELLALHTHGLQNLQSSTDCSDAFHRLLGLFARAENPAHRQWGRAIQQASLQAVAHRGIDHGRPAVFRGLELSLTLDENCLQGLSPFVLGQALAVYVRRSLGINTTLSVRLQCVPSGQVLGLGPQQGLRAMA